MSKAALAREVGISPTAITQFEKGGARPSHGVLAQMCLTLGLPRDFFGAGNPLALLPASEAHFRSLRSTSATEREKALAFGEVSLEVVRLIENYVDFPPLNLPDISVPESMSPEAIASCAAEVRAAWSLPEGPIANMVSLLEAHGILALPLPETTDRKVDAFSTAAGGRPLVFFKPGAGDKARRRFDAAHELGHLVLHPDTEPGSKTVERQAHAFAAEFLMPRRQIEPLLPKRIDWPTLHDLKQTWQVSLRALVYRAHELGRLSDASYRRANQQLAIWGLPEPGELGPAESPRLLGKARALLEENNIDLASILKAGRIPTDLSDMVLSAGTRIRPNVTI
ncbi:XRE family transcriptional regulator [Arthrobacter sp. NEB 688]|uniref:XRE family transcriptional regulator n=1 Tax=Arthrobacter sp. NEB 688 TaxID=904039 RepID=UPI0015665BE7|nr:XRE family transcriptional regulator [Arthrobacter sp. NEB 688]QKE82871.1 ImmA/IrrE family metallo-endopeptidase [Arthrobacter sp. NEB 688]